MADLTLAELALAVGGELNGPGDRVIRGVAPLDSAGPDELSFVANPRYLPYLHGTKAGAVLVAAPMAGRVPEGMWPLRSPGRGEQGRTRRSRVLRGAAFGEGLGLGGCFLQGAVSGGFEERAPVRPWPGCAGPW